MSDPVVVFSTARAKKSWGDVLGYEYLCNERKQVKTLLLIFGHYGLDGSKILNVQDYSDLAKGVGG